MSKEDYDFCKSSHIFVRCRKERATPGRTTCLACRMAERERHARDYAKHVVSLRLMKQPRQWGWSF